jgi:hypothetical protein
MIIEMVPTGPAAASNLFDNFFDVSGEDVLKTRKLLPSKTEESTITCFIAVSMTIGLKNGTLAFIILMLNGFNDGFTIVPNKQK